MLALVALLGTIARKDTHTHTNRIMSFKCERWGKANFLELITLSHKIGPVPFVAQGDQVHNLPTPQPYTLPRSFIHRPHHKLQELAIGFTVVPVVLLSWQRI